MKNENKNNDMHDPYLEDVDDGKIIIPENKKEEKTNPVIVPILCTQCGGKLRAHSLSGTMECPYCGTVFAIADALRNNGIEHNQSDGSDVDSSLDAAERERRDRIREAELNIEKQRLDLYQQALDDEKREKENKRNIIRYILYFFGFIYCFPIPTTLILNKREDIEPKKKQEYIIGAWLAYAIIVFTIAVSNSISSNTTSKPVSTPTPIPQEITQEDIYYLSDDAYEYEKNSQKRDFLDSHRSITVGGYKIEIPSKWIKENDIYIVERDIESGIYVAFNMQRVGGEEIIEEKDLRNDLDSYIEGYFKSEGITNARVLEKKSFKANGIPMVSALVRHEIGAYSISLPSITRIVLFIDVDKKHGIVISMIEADDNIKGYNYDFWKIIKSIKKK